MKNDTFANRLKKAMELNNFKQVDLVNKTKIDKTLINKYLKGISEAKQDNLTLLANALGVDEVWLMGYDVPEVDTNLLNEFLINVNYEDIDTLVKNDKKHELIKHVDDKDLLTLLNPKFAKVYKELDKNYNYFFDLAEDYKKTVKMIKNNYDTDKTNDEIKEIIAEVSQSLPNGKKHKFLNAIIKYYSEDEIISEIERRDFIEIMDKEKNLISNQEKKKKLLADGLKKLFDELDNNAIREDKQ